jgi:hypothetical protein
MPESCPYISYEYHTRVGAHGSVVGCDIVLQGGSLRVLSLDEVDFFQLT